MLSQNVGKIFIQKIVYKKTFFEVGVGLALKEIFTYIDKQ